MAGPKDQLRCCCHCGFHASGMETVVRLKSVLGSDDREVHLAENISVQLELDLVVAGLLDQALW